MHPTVPIRPSRVCHLVIRALLGPVSQDTSSGAKRQVG